MLPRDVMTAAIADCGLAVGARRFPRADVLIDPLPPVPLWRGTSPRNAANSRPDLNDFGSPIVATSAVAVSLPMPGTAVIA